MTDVVAEVKTSDPEDTAVAEAVVVEAVAEVTKVVIEVPEMMETIAVEMKTIGIKIPAIVQDLHTEIRIDYKLKYIG